MVTEILIILVVWLTIGVVIGGWISVDTFRKKVKGAKWVAIGVLLSVVGLLIYLTMRNKLNDTKPVHPSAPEYKFSEPAAPDVPAPAPTVPKTIEPEPFIPQPVPEPEPVRPSPEPMALDSAPLPAPEETRPEYRTWSPGIRDLVEGIPRCPKCGVAVSGFDEFCAECGAKLK
jgi:hypothetical protein